MSERFNYLTVSEFASLKLATEPVERAFQDAIGMYHVGSSLSRKDYRDVDVRLILHDEHFERIFGKTEAHPKCLDTWFLICWAISEWMQKRTGLPIDFQIQSMTEANKPWEEMTADELRAANTYWTKAVEDAGGFSSAHFAAQCLKASVTWGAIRGITLENKYPIRIGEP